MVDFSKLMGQTPEERDARREEQERSRIASELEQRSAAATSFRRFTLAHDPEIRYLRSGEVTAVLRYEKDGVPATAIARSVQAEDERSFVDRFSRLSAGDDLVAHGHMETRRWKDQENRWRSTDEFQVDVPISPDAFRHELPEGVSFPRSAFSISQERAGRSAGMGR